MQRGNIQGLLYSLFRIFQGEPPSEYNVLHSPCQIIKSIDFSNNGA